MIDRVNQFDTIRQFIKMSWERRRPVVACVLCPVSVMRLLSILCGTSLKLRDERLSCVISNYLPFEVQINLFLVQVSLDQQRIPPINNTQPQQLGW